MLDRTRYSVGIAALLLSAAAIAQSEVMWWPEGVFEPRGSRLTMGTAEGSASLSPYTMRVATVGDYTLRFEVGASGIAEGGGLFVDFPKSWFTNPVPLRKELQTDKPDGPHYVSTSASNPDVRLALAISELNFDRKNERFRNIFEIEVTEGSLASGDVITVHFDNTTAPYIAGQNAVQVAVDENGSESYRLIQSGAAYEVIPADAKHVHMFAPSQAVVGKPVELQVTAFDLFYNVTDGPQTQLVFTGLGSTPIVQRYTPARRGIVPLEWTPAEPGFVFPKLQWGPFEVSGGPIQVYAEEASEKIYWGDLHSHSNISKDGIGSGDYDYARDVTRLDFFGSSEHDISDDGHDSITPEEWKRIEDNVRAYYEPGHFVTLLGYECSLSRGHHNVFYRTMDGVPWPGQRLKTIETIWSKLEAGDAITIPHHLGIRWGGGPETITGPGLQEVTTGTRFYPGGPQVDWSGTPQDTLRPVLEIYSKHGTSEYYDANDPLAYEQVKYTRAMSVEGPHYARDAWAAGHSIGVVAASDNHASQPGLPHTGLTAVFASELTRDAVFDALLSRRSYGTTGERIILNFELAGIPMGGRANAGPEVDGKILVAAPTPIAFAEVWRYQKPEGWEMIKRWDMPGRLLDDNFSDSIRGAAVYYLRTELEQSTGGRVARAWSSPIWITNE